MSIKSSAAAWYARIENRSLAKLTPAERVEILAFDSALKRHPWRNVAISIGVWVGLAFVAKLALSRIGWMGSFMLAGVVLISLGMMITSVWFGPSRVKLGVKSVMLFMGMVLAGAVVGGLAAKLALTDDLSHVLEEFARGAPQLLIGGLIAGLIFAVLMVSIVQYRRSQLQRTNSQLIRQAQQERMGRQLADAKLKLMQAQVEPHFLFNTLASVQQLAEGKAPEAAQLTSQLITFLRAGLASLREDSTTLAREFKAIDAYLTIMLTRMPERLAFSLDLPDDIRDTVLPPAMLISLVENAIKHGLEPHPDGGAIDVKARAENGRLKLTVTDTGLGPGVHGKTSGGGVGLDNIRQRLRILYSDNAKLIVSANQPHGFIAIIDIPMPSPSKA